MQLPVRLTPLIRLSLAACAVVLVVGAAESSAERSAGATARAWAIKVIVPGQLAVGTKELSAPDDAVSFDGAFAYPTADGSIVAATSVTTSVSASSGEQASAGASSQVTAVSLFKGEITVATATGEAHALASTASASGDTGVTGLTTLGVLGQPVTPTVNQQIPLADWGYAIALEQKSQRVDTPTPGYHDFVTALDVFLTADHGGLPSGSEIQIGYAEANAQASEPAPLPTAPSTPTITVAKPGHAPGESGPNGPPVLKKPPNVTPKLTAGGYVFPVYGNSSFIDTFGAFRGDVSGGWHHGDDIFAALGSPLLAVADGTVFSVGWNRVGGWRLWLRDNGGNEFYYAHLSAYSPLAVNGAIVHAGDVLGFLGDSGDAQGTPYHLHFEVHPLGLLGLGYDGAVDPTSYLLAWERLKDVRFDAIAGWTPASHGGNAPKAGAILLQSSDISSASGLDPESITRALSSKTEGYGGPLVPQAQQPSAKPVITTP
jgi:murein DD-endopeptidase MepM/ murein hydrolase activator NlpD